MVDSGKSVRAEGIGFGDVRSDIAVGTFGIWNEGCNELLVAGVGEVERFLAVGI